MDDRPVAPSDAGGWANTPRANQKIDLDDVQKVDGWKLLYTEERGNSRFETTSAQKVMTYFGTVELALGAWIVANAPNLLVGERRSPLSQLGFRPHCRAAYLA